MRETNIKEIIIDDDGLEIIIEEEKLSNIESDCFTLLIRTIEKLNKLDN